MEEEKTASATLLKRAIPILEVGVVLVLFYALRLALRGTPFARWQSSAFGGAPISSTLLFFVLPMVVLLAGRRNPCSPASHSTSFPPCRRAPFIC